MEALGSTLEPRPFRALLQGLRMKLFPATGEQIADADLVAIFQKAGAELDEEAMQSEISIFESIMRKAATDHWTAEALLEFLQSRDFPAEHATLFSEFWRREGSKVHSWLLQQVSFNQSMQSLAWRVDMKALSKNSAEANVPVAYFELSLQEPQAQGGEKNFVAFDMSRAEVQDVLGQLSAVQERYDQLLAAAK